MRKILTLIAGLMTCAAAYALPVGNPSAPDLLKYGLWTCGGDCWGLKMGYRGDFVANRKLRFRDGKRIQDFSSATNAGVLTLNLWDRVDIYGWAGASASELTSDDTLPDVVGLFAINAHTKESFAWGAGIKAILWECNRTAIGIDAQYGQSKPSFNRITLGGDGAFAVFDPDTLNHARFREYQISLGISHRICSLVPYLAIKYSSFRGQIHNDATVGASELHLRSHKKWGFVIGTSLVDSERMSVTAEGRFCDERALSILADIRF